MLHLLWRKHALKLNHATPTHYMSSFKFGEGVHLAHMHIKQRSSHFQWISKDCTLMNFLRCSEKSKISLLQHVRVKIRTRHMLLRFKFIWKIRSHYNKIYFRFLIFRYIFFNIEIQTHSFKWWLTWHFDIIKLDTRKEIWKLLDKVIVCDGILTRIILSQRVLKQLC